MDIPCFVHSLAGSWMPLEACVEVLYFGFFRQFS
jgi:hypothetical protein